jgi:hypothetical protein
MTTKMRHVSHDLSNIDSHRTHEEEQGINFAFQTFLTFQLTTRIIQILTDHVITQRVVRLTIPLSRTLIHQPKDL